MAAILAWLMGSGADTLISLLPTIVAILRIWRITQPIITATIMVTDRRNRRCLLVQRI